MFGARSFTAEDAEFAEEGTVAASSFGSYDNSPVNGPLDATRTGFGFISEFELRIAKLNSGSIRVDRSLPSNDFIEDKSADKKS